MTNHSHSPYSTLQESIINLGYEWQEKDYFFCHGVLPVINDTITDMKEYVGILLCTDGDIDISINEVDYNLTASTLLIAHPSSIVHIIRSKRQYKGILLFVARDFLAKNIVNAQLVKPFVKLAIINTHLPTLPKNNRKFIDIMLIYRKEKPNNLCFSLNIIICFWFLFAK